MRDTALTPAGQLTAKTESKTLAAANLNRVALYITNDGEKPVYLALGPTATKNKGIRLNEKGGSIVIEEYRGIVTAVTAEGESTLTYAEL